MAWRYFKRRKFPWWQNLANIVDLSERNNLTLKGGVLWSFQNFCGVFKINSSKKCIIKLLIQFLIYLFRSYEWNAGFSSFTLARLNAICKEAFCLPIYIHVFDALYFVIKEIIANDLQCRVQLLKLNTDGFTKLIFRGKFIFSFYICQICLDEVFLFLVFLNSIQNLWHNVSNCKVL